MAKLKYTDEELIKLYRGAADKNKQIEILADMRCCKPQEIIEMLTCAGEIPGMRKREDAGLKSPQSAEPTAPLMTIKGSLESGGKKNKRMKAPRWTSEELELLQGYIDEGLSYSEIADRFGRNVQAIYDAVRKHGLRGAREKKMQHGDSARASSTTHSGSSASAEPYNAGNDNRSEGLSEPGLEGNVWAEETNTAILGKCVDAAEKRVIVLSNAIADAAAAAKVLHDLIRIAGSGIEDMCEDPASVFQMLLCTMEGVVKEVRRNLTETGEEYDG